MKNVGNANCFPSRGNKYSLKWIIITPFLLFFVFTSAVASDAFSQKVSLNLRNVEIKEVLSKIEVSTDFVFLISDDVEKELHKSVTLNVKNESVANILDFITRDTGLSYKIVERQITVYSKNAPPKPAPQSQQQPFVLTGSVVDEAGQPLTGATISLKGSAAAAAVTDEYGAFSMNGISPGDVIVVSFPGYATSEITVGSRRNVRIALSPVTQNLDEVVVVGYGTQRKVTLTGSVASTSGAEIQKSSAVDISQSLAGRMPGVIVNNRSGEPGADDATTIFIRGRSTLNDNSPLIIIDGVPDRETLSFLNPNDIESVTVLKDASAAIYGSRSANGVILVTTKRGVKGEKPRITFSYDLGLQTPTRLLDMVDAPTFATLYNERNAKLGQNPRYTDAEIQKYRDGSDPILYPNTDWFAEIIKPVSMQHKYNLSFSGGAENVAYFVSAGAVTQDGIYRESATKYNQLHFRSNIDLNVTKSFKIGADIAARIQNKHYSAYPSDSEGIFYRTRDKFPTTAAYYPNGLLAGAGNPIALVSDRTGYDRYRTLRLDASISADWSLDNVVKGLSVKGLASYVNTSTFRKRWQKPYTYYVYNEATEEYDRMLSTDVVTPQLTERYTPDWTLTLNATLNYDRSFNDAHNVSVLLGFEQSEWRQDVMQAERRRYSQDALDELSAGDLDKTYYDNLGWAEEFARRSWFGRATYDYKGKYLFQFILRYDGSMNFPTAKRWGLFPGVSAGWRLSEEGFIKNNVRWLSNLKIRASYGEQGNDNIDPFQYLTSYQYGRNQVFGGTQVNGIYPDVFPNVNVTWEVAKTYNVGLDAGFWNGKLEFEIEAFSTRRSNILCTRNASVPAYTGLTSLPDENIGIVKNRGFELQVSHTGRSNDFSYRLSGNLLFARNEVVYMDEAPWGEGYEYLKQEGHPMGSMLLYDVIGLNKTDDDLLKYPQISGASLGEFIFKRYDPNPSNPNVITSNDMMRVELSTVPEIVYGLTFDGRWKWFDFMVLFQGQARVRYYITPRIDPAEGNIMADIAEGRWSQSTPDSDKPGVGGTINNAGVYPSTYWYRNSAFLRLKNLEIGFNFPEKWLGSSLTGLRNIRFYIGGYNLLTFDSLKIVDPETSSQSSQNYPQLRIFNTGIRMTF